MPTITTAQAADRLSIKSRSVVWLITNGRLVGVKQGRDYAIEESEVERYLRERKPAHRPKKAKE